MATTKMWKVESRLDHVLDYVSNEAKTMASLYDYVSRGKATDNQKYITCINCSYDNPYESMLNLKEIFHDESKIIAYHAVQSFKPGEGNPKMIHELGVKLIEDLFGDKYQVVVCTHLDKEHLHNHFIINPISIIDGKRYNNSKKDIYNFRNTSDKLCKEYGLSVIDEPKGKGQSRKKYFAARSYIKDIQRDIDSLVNRCTNLKQFYECVLMEGYTYVTVDDVDCIVHPNFNKPIPLIWLGHNYNDDTKLQDRMFGKMDKSKIRYKIAYTSEDIDSIMYNFFKGIFKGYQKTYIEFQIKLGIIPNERITKQHLSKDILKECRRLDLITNSTLILLKNNITNIDELNTKLSGLSNELDSLLKKRDSLYKQSYKELDDLVNKAKLNEEAKALTPKIKELRYEIKCVEDVKTRSLKLEEYNKELHQEKEKKEKVRGDRYKN